MRQTPRWRAFLVSRVEADRNARILDVATGTGAVARELRAQNGCVVVGLDQSPEMLAEATQTYAGARMPFTLRSRAQILDLFDGFDLVEPGLVSLPEWRPAFNTDRTPLKGPTVGGVALLRK